MSIKLSTAPTAEPLSLFEVKDQLRLDQDEHTEDDLLNSYISAARKYCEDYQNRTYLSQTWELWLDSWPGKDYIRIPLPPLQSVTSVEYYDTSDTKATFSSDYYFVDTKDQYGGKVCLNSGESWPSTVLRPHNGICVTFIAGYGASPYNVPETVRQAMKLLLGHYYENREETFPGTPITPLPLGVAALLSMEKVY